ERPRGRSDSRRIPLPPRAYAASPPRTERSTGPSRCPWVHDKRAPGRYTGRMTGDSPHPANPDYRDLDRPPLRAEALRRALVRPGALWTGIEVVPEMGSTNTELVARARAGAPAGSVLVTEHQTAGRGRLGRTFTVPARAALTFSVLVRPQAPAARFGWLPLMMGAAAVRAASFVAQVAPVLKWPNDVLAPEEDRDAPPRKLAGILSEAAFSEAGPAVVVGIGLNVSQRREELPVDSA